MSDQYKQLQTRWSNHWFKFVKQDIDQPFIIKTYWRNWT